MEARDTEKLSNFPIITKVIMIVSEQESRSVWPQGHCFELLPCISTRWVLNWTDMPKHEGPWWFLQAHRGQETSHFKMLLDSYFSVLLPVGQPSPSGDKNQKHTRRRARSQFPRQLHLSKRSESSHWRWNPGLSFCVQTRVAATDSAMALIPGHHQEAG